MNYYKITYSNGVTQTKKLISKEKYKEYKKLYIEIDDKEILLNKKDIKLKLEISILKSQLKEFGEFFVADSPIYDAISDSILKLPICQGGNHNINIEKI